MVRRIDDIDKDAREVLAFTASQFLFKFLLSCQNALKQKKAEESISVPFRLAGTCLKTEFHGEDQPSSHESYEEVQSSDDISQLEEETILKLVSKRRRANAFVLQDWQKWAKAKGDQTSRKASVSEARRGDTSESDLPLHGSEEAMGETTERDLTPIGKLLCAARRFLCVDASSAASERSFSNLSAIIKHARRAKRTADTAGELAYVNCNYHITYCARRLEYAKNEEGKTVPASPFVFTGADARRQEVQDSDQDADEEQEENSDEELEEELEEEFDEVLD
eukprot:CAMPEP_0113910934 /NCGR_PEP_ID=MMETSP0780_2-20120614/27856_1 /TAXON_ID=652834 /ORGANISM="Palpitomonas bilix" /LENGTH=279 /DNA_ID=CAMNT_0000907255 /DNA_START=129 /DNA_END=969 /DNA_ORIENTATION=- /assembly_acc=CAM_ASM_000599